MARIRLVLYVHTATVVSHAPLQFMQDAAEVMQLLLKVQTEQGEELEDDDPQVDSNNYDVTLLIGSFCKDLIHDQCLGTHV